MGRRGAWARALCGLVLTLIVAGGSAFGAETVHLFETRDGITVPALIMAPKNPRAVAILFTGGKGVIGVQPDGSLRNGANFLVESRMRFATRGLVTVVLDAPSDRASDGLGGGFRQSAAHATDVRHIMAALRWEYDLPVWLVGTSRGSTSVANAGVRLQAAPPDGLVLTSSISQGNARGGNILDMDLALIRAPVLVAHHLDDDCWVTPYAGAVEIEDALIGSRDVALLAISDGEQRGNPCKPYSHHGFLGQRDQVVATIVRWIFAHSEIK